MEYKVSQELIDIFFKNGFSEITKEQYPNHYIYLQEKGYYEPYSVNRAFSMNKTRSIVKLDNGDIWLCFSGHLYENRKKLTPSQLQSLIAYFKLPSHIQSKLRDYSSPIDKLYSDYKSIGLIPRIYKGKDNIRILNAFKNIIL